MADLSIVPSSQEEEGLDQPFLVDDFFVDDADAGVVIKPVLRGRVVPMTVKRGLNLRDREAAKAAAIKSHLAPNGQLVVDGIDEGALNVEVLVRAIKAWPFTQRDGSPLPITRATIANLGADCVDPIVNEINALTHAVEVAHAPFETPSGEA